MNSGKSPATRRRLVFISSTARAQRLPAFDCSRVSARDADCGSTACGATDIWFFSFLWIVGWNDRTRASAWVRFSGSPAGYGSAWECRRTSIGSGGKARWRHSETQRHQEMPVAEGVKQSDLADRLREQLHRDRVGFKALHILGQVVKIEADISRLSRDAGVLQSDAVGGTVVFGFE